MEILSTSSEASSLAVSIFNKEKLWHFLSVPLLSQNTNYPISLRLAAGKIHYENMSMQYTEIFSPVKVENFIRKSLIFFLFLLKT